jgi:hypothetical protein
VNHELIGRLAGAPAKYIGRWRPSAHHQVGPHSKALEATVSANGPDSSSPLTAPSRRERIRVVASVTFDRPTDRADELRATKGSVRFIEIPAHRFVMVDGDGPPGGEPFRQRVPGLYGTAYKLRFALKAASIETKVGPLEGLWWTESGETDLDRILGSDREDWRWTLLIALPDEATDTQLEPALEAGRAKIDPSTAENLRVESFAEGRVAQILHLGPYATERPTIERLHAAIHGAGLHERGRHHELYIGDPQKAAPERLKTVLRHPVG